jgi:hypothetical protein
MPKTLGNILILAGIAAVLIGLILRLTGRLKWIGKLPCDIIIQKGNFTFYFPLMTGLLTSFFLSLLLFLVFKFFLKR